MSKYLNWQSKLSAKQVFSGGDAFSYPSPVKQGVLYVSTIKKQSSRQVLMLIHDGQRTCLTPPPFNLRTNICEYGGKPYWLDGDDIYFTNGSDQCLYRQTLTGSSVDEPRKVTRELSEQPCSYGDLVKLTDQFMAVIVEQEQGTQENRCYLASLDVSLKPTSPHVICHGADFYTNLVVDSVHQRIAWVEWNHPRMPWDNTELWVADFKIVDDNVSLSNHQQVVMPQPASYCQLIFASNGQLFFSADCADVDPQSPENFWNVYVFDPSSVNGKVQAVTTEQQEFGYPHWQYGDARIAQFDAETLITFASSACNDSVYLIDQNSLQVSKLTTVNGHLQSIAADANGGAVALHLPDKQGSQLVTIEAGSGQLVSLVGNPAMLEADDISQPQHICFATADGASAYGYYYPPRNARYPDSNGEAPPLLVMVHGGPTGRAYGYFDIQKQFWTNRGFAVFDVNHRGSSGYGRHYRDALYAHWGVMDISDIVDGIHYLIAQKMADRRQICIRGKSAGGYTVLNALSTHPDIFKAGACYYGIGNLATLAEMTHKFEKHYTDRLIGEQYDADRAVQPTSMFYQRSPIHHLANLASAMIIFQGLQDKVVPPKVAREVVDMLKSSGIEHRYIEYPDEGHGFRQIANNIDAWTRELQFYRQVLGAAGE